MSTGTVNVHSVKHRKNGFISDFVPEIVVDNDATASTLRLVSGDVTDLDFFVYSQETIYYQKINTDDLAITRANILSGNVPYTLWGTSIEDAAGRIAALISSYNGIVPLLGGTYAQLLEYNDALDSIKSTYSTRPVPFRSVSGKAGDVFYSNTFQVPVDFQSASGYELLIKTSVTGGKIINRATVFAKQSSGYIRTRVTIGFLGYTVEDIDSENKTFIITGEFEDQFSAGELFQVKDSPAGGLDGVYTIVSASSANDTTSIIVEETVPSATAGGTLVHSAIQNSANVVGYAELSYANSDGDWQLAIPRFDVAIYSTMRSITIPDVTSEYVLTPTNTFVTAAALTNYYTKSEIDSDIYTKAATDAQFASFTYLTTNHYTKTEAVTLFYLKSEIDDSFYTKTDVDSSFVSNTDIATNFYNKTETASLFYPKADIDNLFYTKNAIDSSFATLSYLPINFYNKTEIDSSISGLQSLISNCYTKSESDSLYITIGGLADTFYTKEETDNKLPTRFTAATEAARKAILNLSIGDVVYQSSDMTTWIVVNPTTVDTDNGWTQCLRLGSGATDALTAAHAFDSEAHEAEFAAKVGIGHITDATAHSAEFAAKAPNSHTTSPSAHSAEFAEKADVSHLTDAEAHSAEFAAKADVSHLTDAEAHSAEFAAKADVGHLTDAEAHSAKFAAKADVGHLTDAGAHSAEFAAKAPNSHTTSPTAHSAEFANKVDVSHLTDANAHSSTHYSQSQVQTQISSGTYTFTNKTFDAAGTGNSISNISNSCIASNAEIAVSKIAITDTRIPFGTGTSSSTSSNFYFVNGENKLYAHNVEGSKFKVTPDGGYAILLTAGEALYKGEVVYQPQGAVSDETVLKAPTSNDMPIGVVYADASIGNPVWIVVSGRCDVLPESGITAARGNVIYVSASAAGRVAQSSSAPVNDHWKECGHFLASGSGNGVLTKAVVHFN